MVNYKRVIIKEELIDDLLQPQQLNGFVH